MNLAMLNVTLDGGVGRTVPTGAVVILTDEMTLERVSALAREEAERIKKSRPADSDLCAKVVAHLRSSGCEVVFTQSIYIDGR